MTFKVGETVVYPHHGAALIEAIETRVVKGEERPYLRLKVAQGDLTLMVPTDKVEYVGVRDVVDQNGLDRVFEVLRAEYTEEPTNWSRRYKANLEKLASGDVIKVAEVVRDLWRRDRERGLSAGEKRMLGKARQILVSELALAECTNEDKAESILDEVLNSQVVTVPGRQDRHRLTTPFGSRDRGRSRPRDSSGDRVHSRADRRASSGGRAW
jgi:CarD family transcriptional regulator